VGDPILAFFQCFLFLCIVSRHPKRSGVLNFFSIFLDHIPSSLKGGGGSHLPRGLHLKATSQISGFFLVIFYERPQFLAPFFVASPNFAKTIQVCPQETIEKLKKQLIKYKQEPVIFVV
jgi:hypothetical protein